MITKDRTLISISSALSRSLGLLRNARSSSFNFLLQNRGYKIFRTILIEFTQRLLATFRLKVIRVLAKIAVLVMTTCTQKRKKYTYQYWRVYKTAFFNHLPSILVRALSTLISNFLISVYIQANKGKNKRTITKRRIINKIANESDWLSESTRIEASEL